MKYTCLDRRSGHRGDLRDASYVGSVAPQVWKPPHDAAGVVEHQYGGEEARIDHLNASVGFHEDVPLVQVVDDVAVLDGALLQPREHVVVVRHVGGVVPGGLV